MEMKETDQTMHTHDHSTMDHGKMDHSKMDHGKMVSHHHHSMMIEDFKKRFWISLAISIPVLALSAMIQNFLGFSLSFPGDKYILFALSSVIFFYGGFPFLQGLVSEVKAKN